MSRSILSVILLVLVLLAGGICTAGTSSNPNDYPPYYPTETFTEEPSPFPTVTADVPPYYPTEEPTSYPTFTVEPTQIGGDSGWVSIDSTPQGATVYFDGSNEGTTPTTVRVMSTANPSHSIRVSKNGYQDWTDQLYRNPSAGETIYEYAYLAPIEPTFTVEPTQIGGDHGYVYIDSVPQGAMVYFDSVYEGVTPTTVSVSTTGSPSHSVRLEKSGYETWTGTAPGNPAPGQTLYPEVAVLVATQPTITIPPTIIGDDYGFFKIDTYPQGADVYFDSGYQGTSPVLVKVMTTATPSHDLKISMNGYRDYTQHISMNPGSGQTVPLYISLSPYAQYGSIAVTSNPSGALATLDSGQQYLTPCTFTLVLPGTHMLTVSKAGYNTYSQQVSVSTGSQSVYAPLTVIQTTGTLFVDSIPQGADVKVDNTWQGQTPQQIGNLASGYHNVKLQLSGYQTVTQQVLITAGQQTQISPTLVKNPPLTKTGDISVSSNPPGASVYLNGDYQGVTPASGYLDLTDLTPGVYTILLKEPQHEDYSASITVTADQTTPVNVVLKAAVSPSSLNGTLSISSSPSGAQVFLDNQLVGITPVTLSTVKPGQYSLLLKMNGYNDYTNQVQVAAGMSTTASINLTPAAPASPTATPAGTTSPVPTATKSPLPVVLVPAGLVAALLVYRRSR